MEVAFASPSTSIQPAGREEKIDMTVYDATETTSLTVTHETNTVTNNDACASTKKKKKKKKTMLCVLSVAAACAAVLFTWGALVSHSSSTAAIAEAGVALKGVASYPKVNIKNKTIYPASGIVVYAGGCDADLYHVNPGETWMAPKDRGICLVRCVMANLDLPIPFNIAKEYQSSGTSYAAFEILNDDFLGFLVQRPGGNKSGQHLANCSYAAKLWIDSLDYSESCGFWNKYHSVWPPIDRTC